MFFGIVFVFNYILELIIYFFSRNIINKFGKYGVFLVFMFFRGEMYRGKFWIKKIEFVGNFISW